jgi:hypothetical protein
MTRDKGPCLVEHKSHGPCVTNFLQESLQQMRSDLVVIIGIKYSWEIYQDKRQPNAKLQRYPGKGQGKCAAQTL